MSKKTTVGKDLHFYGDIISPSKYCITQNFTQYSNTSYTKYKLT